MARPPILPRPLHRIQFGVWLPLILIQCCFATRADATADSSADSAPKVFQLDGQHLQSVRERVQNGDPQLAPALKQLLEEAAEALTEGPFTVVNKTNVPPSGDRHDYMSVAPYWWPNPETEDGLPYVRHDGKRNPDNRTSDRRNLGHLIDAIETLSLAYFFTGDERYADRAALLLRTWFLDPKSRMNPNFEFAQAVPGANTGRSYGLIETAGLVGMLDAVGLLAESKAWTEADQRGLQEWFRAFLNWMRVSDLGRKESAARNNHGTYYDLQRVTYALFVGQREIVTNLLQEVGLKRIARQIKPDGRQPLELARTNAWGYSVMNLRGLMSLARVGENVGVDLWHYETPDGRGIRKALDCLIDYAEEKREWLPGKSGRPSFHSLGSLLRAAAIHYPDQGYGELLSKLPPLAPSDRANLVHPRETE